MKSFIWVGYVLVLFAISTRQPHSNLEKQVSFLIRCMIQKRCKLILLVLFVMHCLKQLSLKFLTKDGYRDCQYSWHSWFVVITDATSSNLIICYDHACESSTREALIWTQEKITDTSCEYTYTRASWRWVCINIIFDNIDLK